MDKDEAGDVDDKDVLLDIIKDDDDKDKKDEKEINTETDVAESDIPEDEDEKPTVDKTDDKTVTEATEDEGMRKLIEIKYPDFRDYENQESFAGHAVATDSRDGDFYVAYLELGSGIPIVNATCFQVDEQKTVKRIGSFPHPSGSLVSHEEFDPVTCGGNK